jgi:hypothetical protein
LEIENLSFLKNKNINLYNSKLIEESELISLSDYNYLRILLNKNILEVDLLYRASQDGFDA